MQICVFSNIIVCSQHAHYWSYFRGYISILCYCWVLTSCKVIFKIVWVVLYNRWKVYTTNLLELLSDYITVLRLICLQFLQYASMLLSFSFVGWDPSFYFSWKERIFWYSLYFLHLKNSHVHGIFCPFKCQVLKVKVISWNFCNALKKKNVQKSNAIE